MMHIRSLAEADLSTVRAWMQDASEAPAWSDDDLAGIVNEPESDQRKIRRGWVAEGQNGSAVGFVVATALSIPGTPPECELEFMFVSPQSRRQGIGRMLLDTVLAWAHDLRATEIRLEVRASNARALGLYRQCGFAIAGRRPGYYVDPPEDALLMCLRINDGPGDTPV